MQFRGAPDPRWWRIEDGEAFFDSPEEAELNILSTLLPEFAYADVNNWYVIPAPMPAGSKRQVLSLRVTDSFGVVADLKPIADERWRLFFVDPIPGRKETLSAATLFAPNVVLDVMHKDVLEDVRFMRDEQANLVWAWEHCVTRGDGEKVLNGDVPSELQAKKSETSGYRFMLSVAGTWIPYVPRQINPSAANGEIYLRRGRTDPDATSARPQYRARVIVETPRLFEEEIPRTGLRVRRISKFAHGPDDRDHFWVGRHKDAGRGTAGSGLQFDYIAPGQKDLEDAL